MSEIIDQFYTPLLIEHGFIRDPDNQQYGAVGAFSNFGRKFPAVT